MTIIASNQTLTAKDYPDFDQTVGNAFASSFKDTVNEEDKNFEKLKNVTQGLYKIYETVVADAAKGSPMTPTDSAVIANTVANMTSSIGVESDLKPIVSLESRYEQHLGYMVTQESLGSTIKKAIDVLIKSIIGLIDRVRNWVSKMADREMHVSRPLARILNTATRWMNVANTGLARKYTPEMEGILVDGQVPARWVRECATSLSASRRVDATIQLAEYVDDMVKNLEDLVRTKETDLDRITEKVTYHIPIMRMPDLLKPAGAVEDSERTVQYSAPMAGNTIYVAINPVKDSEDPVAFVNVGAGMIPLDMAPEFGIKEKYRTEPAGDAFLSLSVEDIRWSQRSLLNLINNAPEQNAQIDRLLNKTGAGLKAVTEKYRSMTNTVDTEDEAGRMILQYMGVARSILSAAVACLTYNFESRQHVIAGATAAFKAFSK